MASIVLERRFEPGTTEADIDRMAERIGPCMNERDVRWIRSYLSASRERMICLFEAPDAESVRQGFRMAGMPFEAVWQGDVVTPDSG